ncbi:aromatic ring-hydroxylating dioxygenase subunit alpha [Trinickia violacea]|uniref:Aromatic ring-hydroxylating dioxygenase subunit alpha n=1 Tax=Trinickia violacea TaxID=2571746 RepID=A0A4P8J066_9BURK|nr:aromatic ring-hydroxylating dioxygenase subunit alpha [Trinickia violacea]
MAYIRSAWYVACWSSELRTNEIFHRTLLDEQIVFYRKQDGQAVALQDRCPHRFIPLHLGRLKGDVIECCYHGLQFDCTGSCVKNPHGDGRIPTAAKVRSYPVHELYGMVWVWMSDARADPALIPDYSMLDAASGYQLSTGGYLHIDANYVLMGENLLDLSHLTHLHDGYLGSPKQVGADLVLKEEGNHVLCNRWMPNISPPGIFDMLYRRDGKSVDMWTNARWIPPSCFLVDAGVHVAGGEREDRGWYYAMHIVTPETERTTHYFFAAAMPAGTKLNDEDAKVFANLRRFVFEEQDKPVLNAQQICVGDSDFWSLKPVLLSSDAGPVRIRRSIERMLKAEIEQQAQG